MFLLPARAALLLALVGLAAAVGGERRGMPHLVSHVNVPTSVLRAEAVAAAAARAMARSAASAHGALGAAAKGAATALAAPAPAPAPAPASAAAAAASPVAEGAAGNARQGVTVMGPTALEKKGVKHIRPLEDLMVVGGDELPRAASAGALDDKAAGDLTPAFGSAMREDTSEDEVDMPEPEPVALAARKTCIDTDWCTSY